MTTERPMLAAMMAVGLCLSTPAFGVTSADWVEVGDTGELPATAQAPLGSGPLSTISGVLVDLGTANAPVDDVDMYRIVITDPAGFSASVAADLSGNDDTVLWLFDATGRQTLVSDDISPNNLLSAILPGELAGAAAGTYYLALSLYATVAVPDDPAFPVSSWARDPGEFQTGAYTLTLTGAELNPVPLPATAVLLAPALGLLAAGRRRRSGRPASS